MEEEKKKEEEERERSILSRVNGTMRCVSSPNAVRCCEEI